MPGAGPGGFHTLRTSRGIFGEGKLGAIRSDRSGDCPVDSRPGRLPGGASRRARGCRQSWTVGNRGAAAWAGAVTRLPGAGRRDPICRRTNRARTRAKDNKKRAGSRPRPFTWQLNSGLRVFRIPSIRFFGHTLVWAWRLLHWHKVASALVALLIMAVRTLKLGSSSHRSSSEVISGILGHFWRSFFSTGDHSLLWGNPVYFEHAIALLPRSRPLVAIAPRGTRQLAPQRAQQCGKAGVFRWRGTPQLQSQFSCTPSLHHSCCTSGTTRSGPSCSSRIPSSCRRCSLAAWPWTARRWRWRC